MTSDQATTLTEIASTSDMDSFAFSLEGKRKGTFGVDVSAAPLEVLLEMSIRRRQLRCDGLDIKVCGQSAYLSLLRETSVDHRPTTTDSCGVFRFTGTPNAKTLEGMSEFLVRSSKPIEQARIPLSARQRLLGSLGELMDNVFEHSGFAENALAGYWIREKTLQIGVADNGQGVLRAYHQQPGWSQVADAGDALTLAVVDNRSRYGVGSRGTGFRNLVAALRSLDVTLRVSSDDASIETDPRGADAHKFLIREKTPLIGFVVAATIKLQGV